MPANRAALGLCINIDQGRHMAGRTYGTKGSQTLAEFAAAYETSTARLTDDAGCASAGSRCCAPSCARNATEMRGFVRRADSDPVWADINDEDWPDAEKPRLIARVREQVLEGRPSWRGRTWSALAT